MCGPICRRAIPIARPQRLTPVERLKAAWAWLLALFGGRVWLMALTGGVLVVLVAGAAIWRDDIARTLLDPKVPYQTYEPPKPPDYAKASAWSLIPHSPTIWTKSDPPADIFFVQPTTYDGGRNWNGPIDDARANRVLANVMLPNYAGPFAKVGRVFAPRYRQASLYAMLTLRDDARDARRFAYNDVRTAWRYYLDRYNRGRPVILVGVEQGGALAARLLAEQIEHDPETMKRLAGVYLIETAAPAEAYGPTSPVPGCARRDQAGCVVGYAMALELDVDRANDIRNRSVSFDEQGALVNLNGRKALCVNPLTGGLTVDRATQRLNQGAANATGLEWGARPAFLQRQVWAQCVDGVLTVGHPRSPSLRPSGSWADRKRAPNYNLFYADLEADARARVAALERQPGYVKPQPDIGGVIEVRSAPIHRIN